MKPTDVEVYQTPKGDEYFINLPEILQIVNRAGFWYAQKNLRHSFNLIQKRKDLAGLTAKRRLIEVTNLINCGKLKQANDKLRNWKSEIETNSTRFQTRVQRTKAMYEFLDGCLVKKFGADVTVAAIGVGLIFCPVGGLMIGAAVLSAGITGYAEYNYAGGSGLRSVAMAGLSVVPCATELMPFSKSLVISLRTGVNFEASLAKVGLDSAAGGVGEYINSGSIKSAIVQATVAGAGGVGINKESAALHASKKASRYHGSARHMVLENVREAATVAASKAERHLKQMNTTTSLAVSASNIYNGSIRATSTIRSSGHTLLRYQQGQETYIWEPFPKNIPYSQRR
jgi:hypothetical protein